MLPCPVKFVVSPAIVSLIVMLLSILNVSHSFWNRFLATGTKWLNITYPNATVAFLSINGEIGFGIGQLGATIPASVEWLPGVGAEQQ
jgi:hypothetical protein